MKQDVKQVVHICASKSRSTSNKLDIKHKEEGKIGQYTSRPRIFVAKTGHFGNVLKQLILKFLSGKFTI